MCCGARMPAARTADVESAPVTPGSGGRWEVTVPGEDRPRVVGSRAEALTLTASGGGMRQLS